MCEFCSKNRLIFVITEHPAGFEPESVGLASSRPDPISTYTYSLFRAIEKRSRDILNQFQHYQIESCSEIHLSRPQIYLPLTSAAV